MKRILSILTGSVSIVALSTIAAACEKQETPSTPEDRKIKELESKVQILQSIDPSIYIKFQKIVSQLKQDKTLLISDIDKYLSEIEQIISTQHNLITQLQAQEDSLDKMIQEINSNAILASELNSSIQEANKLGSSIKKLDLAHSSIQVINEKLGQIQEQFNTLQQLKEATQKKIAIAFSKLDIEIDSLRAQINSLSQTHKAQADKFNQELQVAVIDKKASLSSILQVEELIKIVKQIETQVQSTASSAEEQKALKITAFNNLKATALELIDQINQFDTNYATKLKNQIQLLSVNLEQENLEKLDGQIQVLKQLKQEYTSYINQHNLIVSQINATLEQARNVLLPSLNQEIFKTASDNIYQQLIDYLASINNFKIPNEALNKLLQETNSFIEQITVKKNEILQAQAKYQSQVAQAKSTIKTLAADILQILNQIQPYDSNYVIGVKEEVTLLKEQSLGQENISLLQENVKRMQQILHETQANLNARNQLLDKLSNISKRNIDNYIKKFTRPLFTQGQNSLLQQANSIKQFLSQDFRTKTLSQLRTLEDQYIEMFKHFETNYNTTLQEAETIKSSALELKAKIYQKPAADLNQKEQEIVQYLESLPLGNIELLPGDSLSQTLQKLKQYQGELENENN
ncbi:hypothetical protein ACNQ1O_00150 [Mycoplasma sp. B6188]|uniref:hypothetical protein n=1 Tax=Mycoplasma sp. B6188 TaxID=3401673 RepID=UPI003AAC003A